MKRPGFLPIDEYVGLAVYRVSRWLAPIRAARATRARGSRSERTAPTEIAAAYRVRAGTWLVRPDIAA